MINFYLDEDTYTYCYLYLYEIVYYYMEYIFVFNKMFFFLTVHVLFYVQSMLNTMYQEL